MTDVNSTVSPTDPTPAADPSLVPADPLEKSLETQTAAIRDAESIIRSVADSLELHLGTDWPDHLPNVPDGLRRAAAILDGSAGPLEAH